MSTPPQSVITLSDVQEAAERVKPFIHKTPVMTSETLNTMSGRSLHFKCEQFQKIGAFKVASLLLIALYSDNFLLHVPMQQ